MSRPDLSQASSRLVRTAGVAFAAITSIATFGGSSDWEMHDQDEGETPVQLSASAASWSQDFRGSGAGTGAKRMRLDGAIEVTPSATLDTPVRVRLRFAPMDGSEPVEETVFLTGTEVFTAVHTDVICAADVTCINEGTLSIDVLDTAELGANTLSVHWVSTASLIGRGPAQPADARLSISTPDP